ncbi:MAG: hypothetical protein C4524_00720 [Candidatus Zixiibacteriota bacterium]|nr:MAG: hypothetical protein C4524_00720 [candidate division Zixibacteria bacterium]
MTWDANIRARLTDLRRALVHLQVTTGAWRALAAAGAVCLLLAFLELAFHFGPEVRGPLFGIGLAALTLAIGGGLVWPLLRARFRPASSTDLALRWGRSLEGVNDRLLNALQVYDNRTVDRTSPELAELSLATVAKELEGASFEGALNREPLRRSRQWALVVVGFWAATLLVTRGDLGAAVGRLLQPGTDFGPSLPFTLALEEMPALAVRGEPLDVAVQGRANDALGGQLPRDVTLRVQEKNVDPVDHRLALDSLGRGRLTLPDPQADLAIWAFAGKITSDTARVAVKPRPFLKELEVRWFPPAYSGLPSGSSAQKRGDVAALKGSRIQISLQADRELASAELRLFADARPDSPAIRAMDRRGDRAQAEFVLMESGHYNLILTDRDGIESAAPVDYSLWPIQDEGPTVEIIYPPGDAELNESLIIPLKGQARDDFAISRVRLGHYLVKGGQADSATVDEKAFEWTRLDFQAMGDGSFLVDHLWDATSLNLLPGDELLYRLEALDNDQVSGPKRALSPIQRLRFPTLEEIFTRMEEGQGQQAQDVQETVDRSRILKEELDALREELKRNPELSWEERKKVEDLVKRQEQMGKQVEEMSRQMEEALRQMEENRLFSEESMQKYQELQKLVAEIMSPELLQAMQKLQEALQKQDPENLRRAVEEFSLNQEEFMAKMEKTMNILKQLQQEMKLDELARRAEDLLQKQQEINEQLDQAGQEGARPEQSQAEAELQREMEAFEREFAQAQEMLKDSPHNPEQAMQEAQELLDENQFPQTMGQMSQELSQGQTPQARQKGSKLQSGLAQLSQKMKQAKQQMVDSAKNDLAQAMQKVAHDLLELSYQQEDLLNNSTTMDKASPRFREQAQEQQDLKNHLEKVAQDLFKLSQQSFFITPQMGAAMDQAFRGMDQALMGYTARSPQSVGMQQQSAMGGINRTIMELSNALGQMSQSSSATGFSEMMEQLSQMAGQQGQINQGTMSLLPGGTNPGSMSLEQQAAMSRLAAEQEALRQQMEQWNQANQQNQQMLGRLGELGKEMQQVIDDLKNRQVDERTLKRQEQILTRLLDAQRSVREREYRKERLSRTAEGDYFRASPGEVDPGLAPDEAREQLLRALREGYTRDYQQLIREYFEALGRENPQK